MRLKILLLFVLVLAVTLAVHHHSLVTQSARARLCVAPSSAA